jgi:GT2 family glycosyltransferase
VIDVWVVVVNWNGAALLPGCLDAMRHGAAGARIAVADNGSTDRSADVVARHPGVEWVPLGRNVGFAAANNVLLRRALAAGARWIALVNPDVRLEPGWLETLVAAGEAAPDAGLLQGLLLFADRPQVVNSTGLVLDALGRARDRDFGVPLADLRRTDGPVPGVTGGAVLLRAEMLREVGLLDPAYFAYYEDLDLSLRARKAGWRCRYVSGARALHGYEQSFGSGSPFKRYLLARNHLLCMATHLPLGRAALLVPTLAFARAAAKAPVELLLGRPRHALAHLRGAGAGAAAAARILVRRMRKGAGPPPGSSCAREPGESVDAAPET